MGTSLESSAKDAWYAAMRALIDMVAAGDACSSWAARGTVMTRPKIALWLALDLAAILVFALPQLFAQPPLSTGALIAVIAWLAGAGVLVPALVAPVCMFQNEFRSKASAKNSDMITLGVNRWNNITSKRFRAS